MTGAGARKTHDRLRREKLKLKHECNYKDENGWHPKAGWSSPRGAKRAIDRISEDTGRFYELYECRVCGLFHIKPDKRSWRALRASLLVQMLEERSGN